MTVIPELAYADVNAAADWLARVFGFGVRLRIGDHRVQMNIPGGGAMVAIELGHNSVNGAHAVMVRVENVSAHYGQAKAGGARITRSPQDYPFGERQYSAQDLGGHWWTFTESIDDVDPRDWGGEPVQLTSRPSSSF